jgi:hypothetical protein
MSRVNDRLKFRSNSGSSFGENRNHKAHFLKMFVYLRTTSPHRRTISPRTGAGDAAESYVKARAGYRLAQFVLSKESPGCDSFWATKLLQELYDAHAEPTLQAVGYESRQTATG